MGPAWQGLTGHRFWDVRDGHFALKDYEQILREEDMIATCSFLRLQRSAASNPGGWDRNEGV